MQTQENTIGNFVEAQRQVYGKHFFLEETSPEKFVVMTEKLAQKLRAQLNNPEIKVTSLDMDESVGTYFRVKPAKTGKMRHYHRDSKEMDRLLHGLGDANMITIETEGGETVMVNELMNGELFRGFTPAGYEGWLAIAVDHDYEGLAPKVLGWIKKDETIIEEVTAKDFFRPTNLMDLKTAQMNMLGLPYHLGGKSDGTGYDCSSMIQRIMFETKGVWVPKLASWQFGSAKKIKEGDLSIGDLVFFYEPPGESVEHVAMISGNSGGVWEIMHASPYHQKIIKEVFLQKEKEERGYYLKGYGRF